MFKGKVVEPVSTEERSETRVDRLKFGLLKTSNLARVVRENFVHRKTSGRGVETSHIPRNDIKVVVAHLATGMAHMNLGEGSPN
jgi:hypothetical protein